MCAGLMVCNAASASSNAGLAASSFSSATALSSYWSKNSMFSVSYWFPPSTLSNCNCNVGSKGGAVVRALASHQCGPSSNPGVDAICGLSLLLVLPLAPRGFSPGTPVFPSPQKPTFPNSNSTRNQVDEEPLCGCATCKSLFILFYLFIYSFTVNPLLRPPGAH